MDKIIQIMSLARKQRNISQAELGQKLGMPQSHISKIEKGDVDIRLSSLVDMTRLLGLELMAVPRELVPLVHSLITPATSEEEQSLPEMLLSEDTEEVE